MIDIRNAQIVTYGNGLKSITVYFDFEEGAKKYYIVPVPHLVMATSGDLPVFSMTKYKSNEGKVKGLCTFDVELYVPDDALFAVKQALEAEGKGDYVQGQFDWASVNTYFKYVLNNEEQVANMIPSMYGQNRVSFVIILDTDQDVTTFINAFSTGGGATSPFSIEYDMTCLTRLKGIEATVTYKADVAVTWQNTYKTEKDTWGNSRSVVAEVKKNLKQSRAGDVYVSPKEHVSEETLQRAKDWAWTTLEKMVSDAVTVANQAATSQNPVQATSSFVQNYKEDQVVEWSVKGADSLPMFNSEIWARLYQEVDLRQLTVNFNLVGNFGSDAATNIDKVDITVMYQGTEPVTKSLYPTGSTSSFTYNAPGAFEDKVFIDTYQYKYTIYFKDTAKSPYISEIKTATDTVVNINPALLGIQSVTFTGTNIPFKSGKSNLNENGVTIVERLIIDFYYNRPQGEPNKTEQKVMTANNTAVTFESIYDLPIENTYTYRLTYIMTDGQQMIIDPVRNFGANNSNTVLVNYPLQKITFTVKASKEGDDTIKTVLLNAQYIDDQNPGLKPDFTFERWKPVFEDDYAENNQIWEFDAVKNTAGASYIINGTLIYEKQGRIEINEYVVAAKTPYIFLYTDKEQASVGIDWSLIDWDNVANVEVTLFQTDGDTLPAESVKHILHPESLDNVAGPRQMNKQNSTVLYSDKAIKPRLLYNITKDFDLEKFEYWMGVTYNQKNGTKTYLKTEKTDNLLYTLPPNGNSPEMHISFMSVDVENPSYIRKEEQKEETQS